MFTTSAFDLITGTECRDFWFLKLHCSWGKWKHIVVHSCSRKWNEIYLENAIFISQRRGWPWDSRISGFFSFQNEQNKMNLTQCNLLHARNTSFESASEFRSYVSVGKYNWHCIFSIRIVAGLDESAGIWWSVVNQWFLSYWFKFQPICQRLVNLADHRSLVSLQNCVGCTRIIH